MSMDTGDPTATDISLTYDEEATSGALATKPAASPSGPAPGRQRLTRLMRLSRTMVRPIPMSRSTLTTRYLQHRRFRVVGQMSRGTSTSTSLRTPIGTNSALTRAPEWR